MNLLHLPLLLAQDTYDATAQTEQLNPIVGLIMGLIGLGIFVVVVASLWKLFTKAGLPGWGAIVPFYNLYLFCKVSGKPGWWLIFLIIPYVNFIFLIFVMIGLAKNFGKDGGFAVGLILLGIIFLPILAFGDARYVGAPALPGSTGLNPV